MAEKNKPFYKRWWFIAIVAIVLISIIVNLGEDDNTADEDSNTVEENNAAVENEENETSENITQEEQQENEAQDEGVEEETDEEAKVEDDDQVRFGSGMFVVNDEIEPGLYRTDQGINYWERLSGFSGEFDDIIANGLPDGQSYVEILESDVAFNSQGSGEWVKVEEDYEGEKLTEFGDGQYIVGKDIEPGRYKNDEVTSGFGYWARLSGFTGELDDIITNDNIEGSVIVEISESDFGFETNGCGTWKKID